MSKEWLQGIEAGDKVIRCNGCQKDIVEVVRVTPTQIVLQHTRYRKSDGWQITSNRWNHSWLKPMNDDDKAEIMLRDSRYSVSKIKVDELTQSQCDAILAIVKQHA